MSPASGGRRIPPGPPSPDGAFVDPGDPTLQNYKTSVTLLALCALDRQKHAGAIQKAQA